MRIRFGRGLDLRIYGVCLQYVTNASAIYLRLEAPSTSFLTLSVLYDLQRKARLSYYHLGRPGHVLSYSRNSD